LKECHQQLNNMPKLLQINASVNIGSTGHIAEQINILAQKRGWDIYFAYGRRCRPSCSVTIRIGSKLNVYEHYLEHILFDNDGLASRKATRFLLEEIERIKPDVIHLHNIHDHWLNYEIFFNAIRNLNVQIVWTQHDCWAFTGGCTHFSYIGCFQWRDGGCKNKCPMKARGRVGFLVERTGYHYNLKKKLITSLNNLTIVTVSKWLEDIERNSFLSHQNIVTINNGIDLLEFNRIPSDGVRIKYNIGNHKYVIGVSSIWKKYKGWHDYLNLASIMPNDIKIVLVGLSDEQIEEAKTRGIIGITHTEDKRELAALYSGAEVVLNLSYQESFGLTTIEGLACGTPGIVYNCTASPELLSPDTGFIVEPGNINEVLNAIYNIISNNKYDYIKACRERVEKFFNKDTCFSKYIELYNQIIDKK